MFRLFVTIDGPQQPGAQNTVDHRGINDDASHLIECEIRFSQFGCFGGLAVHISDIGRPRLTVANMSKIAGACQATHRFNQPARHAARSAR